MKYLTFMKKCSLFVILFSFISLTLFMNNSIALDVDEISMSTEVRFHMFETAITDGYFQNASSVEVDLPSTSWSIKDVQINFSNIEFSTELKTIEDNPTNHELIDKHHDGFGVQIKLSDPTILSGIEIYGRNASTVNTPIFIKIYGFNNETNAPNNDLYGIPTLLNMPFSDSAAWHLQTLNSPINLLPGNYYLAIDGSSIGTSPQPVYYWYLNDVNPFYPDLYISSLDSGSWLEGTQGTPFLYKLIQKVNTSIFPENINMTAKIDGNAYNVLNCKSHGKGYLKKTDLNYNPNKNKLEIKIQNNKTSQLLFDAGYNFTINNVLRIPGELKGKFNSDNEWILTPQIKKVSNSHNLQFVYPNSWFDVQVFKNQQDITSELLIDTINNSIFIHNDIIDNTSNWEIKAKSHNIHFNLNTPKTDFDTGQNLEFSIDNPILFGNYSFYLYSPLGQVVFNITKELPTMNNVFSYNIPSNAIDGEYIAFIIWSNKTDAGVQFKTFQITYSSNGNPLDISIFLILGLVLTGGVVIGGSSYVVIKKVDSKKRDSLSLVLENCTEIMSLKHIIVLHGKSGIDVYSESYEEEELEPTLISGFLQAIHNFGTEVLEKSRDTRTVKVEYQKSIILMTEFVNLKLIIIMGKNPSKNFLYSVESLAYYIYKYYGKLLDNFDGGLKQFLGISKLIEKILNVSFIAPLKITMNKNVKLSLNEKEMVNKASKFMRGQDFDYFHSIYLLPENNCSPKDYEIILKLIKKGIFTPIEKEQD
ncbi:MAG: hypothetical protein ACFE9S_08335 [Candidatus Hermodarchaeota archaeon]